MSVPSYAQALRELAQERVAADALSGWQAKVQRLSPEFSENLPKSLVESSDSASLSLFEILVEEVTAELQQLCATTAQLIAASPGENRLLYEVDDVAFGAGALQLIELWRMGIALVWTRDPEGVEHPVELLKRGIAKDLRGAWRVAQRRSQSFASAGYRLHRPGKLQRGQARRLESAFCVLLSGPARLCSRSDLASDWLEGVDLWRYAPGRAPAKGQGLALSMTRSVEMSEKKSGKVDLWSPHQLSVRLIQALQDPSSLEAQQAWEALGSPVGSEALAIALHARFQVTAGLTRGVHPLTGTGPALLRWFRRI